MLSVCVESSAYLILNVVPHVCEVCSVQVLVLNLGKCPVAAQFKWGVLGAENVLDPQSCHSLQRQAG